MNKKDSILHAKVLTGDPNPEKLVAFLDLYLDGMPPKIAWVEAGYAESTAPKAMNKVRENWRLIDTMIDDRIGQHAPLALSVVVDLMQHAKSETVKLNAAKDILSRAGKDKPIELRHTSQAPEDLTEDQLDAEIISLAERLEIGKEHTS